ncbi:uncharacterized protein B0P05DRAFT_492686 [Gilbertella persicaria]|uniref:EF-hand domain-containing protein n=1 Tax=Rhizopus stolonifer TaxID=4846 RepID=A0A367JKJ0_RHIST|nr:uncharacterized protein B0P05DRAFT_492686 [Gilbertella persicaria]KAI8076686.1 hypothetical protein B0P05DRAFT_492686 [Gilbertella persicaria]RCH90448.1 hypothetical protein CU098_010387 [Rhizopus stolonifer]
MQYRSLLLFLALSFCILLVNAIEFKNQDHSNYGDDKENKEHIREHLRKLSATSGEEPTDLSDDDMIYYLFLIHDLNGDGFLDGHELRAAFTDFGDEHEDATKYLSLEEVTEMVDHVLEEDDLDGDGLISWSEYLESQNYHHAEVVLK